MRLLAVTVLLSLTIASHGFAQDAFAFEGTIIDITAPFKPNYSIPTALIRASRIKNGNSQEFFSDSVTYQEKDYKHLFTKILEGREKFIFSTLAVQVFFQNNDYILAEGKPRTQVIDPSELGVSGKIEMVLEVVPVAVRANAREREAIAALSGSNLNEVVFERAYNLQKEAIELDPLLRRYRNLIDIFGKAQRQKYYGILVNLHREEDLMLLRGYDRMDFVTRWDLQSELLFVLASIEDTTTSIGAGITSGEAAANLGRSMIKALADGGDYAELPVIRVFQTLSNLDIRNSDCVSLANHSERALELSDEATMIWSTQRNFLLEWANCLQRRSGIGDGRSLDAFVADTAEAPPLTREWCRFRNAAVERRNEFFYPAGSADEQLKTVYQIAESIIERSDCQ